MKNNNKEVWGRLVRLNALLTMTAAIILGGCASSVNRPMSTSLTSLTSESAATETTLINYSELFSVAGLLPMPDVGVMYYQPSPGIWDKLFSNRDYGEFKSIGIARYPAVRKSFKLIGVTKGMPEHKDVIKAANLIDQLNEVSAKGVSYLIEKSAITQQLNNLKMQGALFASKDYKPDEDELVVNIANKEIKVDKETMRRIIDEQIDQARTSLDNICTDIRDNDAVIKDLKGETQKAMSAPGMIVAQWSTKSTVSGSAGTESSDDEDAFSEDNDVDSLLSISASVDKGESGLVVIGGIRLVNLYLADDYMKMMASANDPNYKKLLGEVGVSTSLMQTKYVSYSSNTNLASSIKSQINIKARSLYGVSPSSIVQGLDTAKLSSYLSNVSNLSNKGNVGNLRWFREDVDFGKCKGTKVEEGSQGKSAIVQNNAGNNSKQQVDGSCEFAAMMRGNDRNKHDNDNDGEKELTGYDGWITLQVVQSRLDSDVLKRLLEENDEHKGARRPGKTGGR